MTDFLSEMAASSRERVAAARRSCPEAVLWESAIASPAPPPLRPSAAGFDLIAEVKLRSPSLGRLAGTATDVASHVRAYARAGAAAISILTEPSRFDGSLTHLRVAAEALLPLGIPAMRKDFLVDSYQLLEARVAGAGGVLIIVRLLPPPQIEHLLECAAKLGLFVLLEAFDEADLAIMRSLIGRRPPSAGSTAPLLAGLNCRDLATLRIVPQRLEALAALLPPDVPHVAESGVTAAEDADRIARAGYRYALVGSALMQEPNPGALAAALLRAGRAASLCAPR
ncbi:MAG TPA: indole-3-glycerol-phosphate synthase [Steroidobacteraceae bacterium]